jgi:uncharacterized protein YjbI with pentapeptide repeats
VNRFRLRLLGTTNSSGSLTTKALHQHIERAFVAHENKLPGTCIQRRIAVRMAKSLEAGGFKRHVEATSLVVRGIYEDACAVDGFQATEEDLRKILRVSYSPIGKQGENVARIRLGLKKIGKSAKRARAVSAFVSELSRAGYQALEWLTEARVIKSSVSNVGATVRQERNYELGHDGFGTPVREWADESQMKAGTTVAAITPIRGTQFRWTELSPWTLTGTSPSDARRSSARIRLEGKRWLGCHLTGVRVMGIDFASCDFSGTMFEDCEFDDCTFTNCTLAGTVFHDGAWTSNVVLSHCDLQSMFIRNLSWGGLTIQRCNLDGVCFVSLLVRGSVSVSESSIRFAQIASKVEGKGEGFVNCQDCDFHSSHIDGAAQDSHWTFARGIRPSNVLPQRSVKKCGCSVHADVAPLVRLSGRRNAPARP